MTTKNKAYPTIENTVFAPIKRTATLTGLSQHFLRAGCKAGTIPCVRSGSKYMIDVPALLAQLRQQPKERSAS